MEEIKNAIDREREGLCLRDRIIERKRGKETVREKVK